MHTTNILIKKATLQHASALETLARFTFTATFGHAYSSDNLENHLAKTCSAAFFEQDIAQDCAIDIAYAENEPVGYIKYGAVGLPIEHAAQDRELHRLYVAPLHQKKNIGKTLLEHAFNSCEMLSAPSIFLGVWEYIVIPNKKNTFLLG